jgi:predicted unusual protein kinase regulating ubiquinone biosynthesis (AarF/ABC1/UbiB family)
MIFLSPAFCLFLLNRISNGRIVSELVVARIFTSSLQFLGPAAIKFGQWASSRDDLFPPVFTLELSRLQSSAASHPLQHTLHEMQEMLQTYRSLSLSNTGVRLEDVSPAPIGSGSIAQVHRAKLVGLVSNGAVDVVVKVLHPRVREQMSLDTQVWPHLNVFCFLHFVLLQIHPSSRYFVH